MGSRLFDFAILMPAILFLGINAAMAIAASPVDQAAYARAGQRLDEAIREEMRKFDIHGVAVALVDDQRIVHLAGLGDAKPDSIFRAGSISKLFNAVAIMQLVEQGKLGLDAPIQRYGEQFSIVVPAEKSIPITLRMLLCHRSGMIREAPVGGYLDSSQPALADMVASVRSCVLIDPPNTKTRYSNVGPSIAGQIAATVAGVPYERLLQGKVLAPLGMTSSSFLTKDVPRGRMATGWMQITEGKGSFRRGEAPVFDLGTLPAGNLWTTAGDLAKFVSMLAAGGKAGDRQIISRKTLDEMWIPQLISADAGYGIAFRVGKFRNHKAVGHLGAVYGHTSSVVFLPETKIGVVLLCNEDIATGPINKLTNVALGLMLEAKLGEKLPAPTKPREVLPRELEPLTGEYESPSHWATIEFANGKLSGKIGGQPIELTPTVAPSGPDSAKANTIAFVADGRLLDSSPVQFERDATGRGIAFQAMGQSFTRVDPNAAALVPPLWSEFVGMYGSDFIPLVISIRHGHLYAQIENEYDYRLIPVSRNVFLCPPGMYDEESIVFCPGPDGKIHGVSIANMYLKRRGE